MPPPRNAGGQHRVLPISPPSFLARSRDCGYKPGGGRKAAGEYREEGYCGFCNRGGIQNLARHLLFQCIGLEIVGPRAELAAAVEDADTRKAYAADRMGRADLALMTAKDVRVDVLRFIVRLLYPGSHWPQAEGEWDFDIDS